VTTAFLINYKIFDYRKGLPAIHSVRANANQYRAADSAIDLANHKPSASIALENVYLGRCNPDIFVVGQQLTIQRLQDDGICALRSSDSQTRDHGVQ
jgi:hypothetical protein